MNGTWYFIEACDVWMFRDGRPFAAGESHLIQSLFPPSALTVQGALRSLVLYAEGVDLSLLNENAPHPKVGWGKDLGLFEMQGPYLAYWQRVGKTPQPSDKVVQVVPLPADLSYTKHDTYTRLQPSEITPATRLTNFPNPSMFALESVEEVDDPPDQAWLGMDVFENLYLRGHIPSISDREDGIAYSSEFFEEEPRFGIGMDQRKRRPADSMLYRAAFKRPTGDTGLLVKVSDGVTLPKSPTLFALGGEGRAARLFPLNAQQVVSADALTPPTHAGKLKVVLLSPAYFQGDRKGQGVSSWQPAAGWAQFFGGSSVTLRATALPHYQAVGGWDMQNRRSRPLVRLVPAGAVFYFESDVMPTRPLTETPDGFPNFEKLGYGQFAVGTW